MSSSVIFFHISPPSSWAFLLTPFKGFGNASSFINSAFSSQDSATSPLLDFKAFAVCWPPGFIYLNTCQTQSLVAELNNFCHISVFDCRIILLRLLCCFLTCCCDTSPFFLALFINPQIFLFAAIPTVHHLLDLAQTLIFLQHLIR